MPCWRSLRTVPAASVVRRALREHAPFFFKPVGRNGAGPEEARGRGEARRFGEQPHGERGGVDDPDALGLRSAAQESEC